MSPDRWQQVARLFDELVCLSPVDRVPRLDAACAQDPELRRLVQRLLSDDERADGFLTPPQPLAAPASPDAAYVDPAVGAMIGAYRLERQIAVGGMGAVWLAQRADGQFTGHAAVKLIHRGGPAGDIQRRFQQERQVLANLKHPHISRLLDGGVTKDGRQYLIMEYVDGQPIDEFCEQHQLPLAARLDLFRDVCSAVHYAHQNLIVHRDLKPGNILVSADGKPTLLDFGIAKLLGATAQSAPAHMTLTGQRWLTPGYASPEQIKGETITTASDVYSLGVVLYGLVTGRGPYQVASGSAMEFERAVCEQQPTMPSRSILGDGSTPNAGDNRPLPRCGLNARALRRALADDLDNIILMALRKEPQRRYASAEQLSEDLRRHRLGIPVMARPDTLRYRGAKFARRNPIGVGLACVVFALLLTLTIVTRIQSARVAEQHRIADVRYQQTRQVADFQAAMLGAVNIEGLGRTMLTELRRQVETVMPYRWVEDQGRMRPMSAEETRLAMKAFDDAVSPSNATETARKLMDVGMLTPAAKEIGRRFEQQPDVALKLRYNVARVYQTQGYYDQALAHYSAVLEGQRRLAGVDPAELAATLNGIGEVHRLKRQYAEAVPFIREAMTICNDKLGPEHVETARGANDLGLLSLDQGDLDSGEALLRDALAARRRLLGDTHEDVAATLNALAHLLSRRRDLAGAEALLRESLAIHRSLYGDEHWLVALSMNNLAGMLHEKGEFAAAEPLLREAMRIRIKVLGEAHADTLNVINNLAGVCLKLNRPADAEPLARQALAGRIRWLPPGHSDIAASKVLLADVISALDRTAEAEALLSEAWDALRSNPQSTEMWRRKTLERLVKCHQTLGNAQRAAEYELLLKQ